MALTLQVQQKIDTARVSREAAADKFIDSLSGSNDATDVGSGIKVRLGTEKMETPDFTLIDIMGQQANTHRPKKPESPLPDTPSPKPSPEASPDDSGVATGDGTDAADVLEVNVSKNDMIFSPTHNSTMEEPQQGQLPPGFNPSIPPPAYKKRTSQVSTSTNPQGEVRKRVIVESIGDGKGKGAPGQPLMEADLTRFRARLEAHIFEFNNQLDDNLP